jgi:hypothetical protein
MKRFKGVVLGLMLTAAIAFSALSAGDALAWHKGKHHGGHFGDFYGGGFGIVFPGGGVYLNGNNGGVYVPGAFEIEW